MMEASHAYDDIIDLPHHVSSDRPHMPMLDRAAQFAPFAALTGYEDAIRETGRLTEEKPEPDDGEKLVINSRLAALRDRVPEKPEVTLTYFVPDGKKAGGKVTTRKACVKKVDGDAGRLLLTDGTAVPFDDILSLLPEDSGGA